MRSCRDDSWLLITMVFCVLYLISSPVRNQFFNSPSFVVPLLFSVALFGWMVRRMAFSVRLLLFAVLFGIIAPAFIYLFQLLVAGNSLVTSRVMLRAGVLQSTAVVLFFPLASYAFLLLPIAVVSRKFIDRRARTAGKGTNNGVRDN